MLQGSDIVLPAPQATTPCDYHVSHIFCSLTYSSKHDLARAVTCDETGRRCTCPEVLCEQSISTCSPCQTLPHSHAEPNERSSPRCAIRRAQEQNGHCTDVFIDHRRQRRRVTVDIRTGLMLVYAQADSEAACQRVGIPNVDTELEHADASECSIASLVSPVLVDRQPCLHPAHSSAIRGLAYLPSVVFPTRLWLESRSIGANGQLPELVNGV